MKSILTLRCPIKCQEAREQLNASMQQQNIPIRVYSDEPTSKGWVIQYMGKIFATWTYGNACFIIQRDTEREHEYMNSDFLEIGPEQLERSEAA